MTQKPENVSNQGDALKDCQAEMKMLRTRSREREAMLIEALEYYALCVHCDVNSDETDQCDCGKAREALKAVRGE